MVGLAIIAGTIITNLKDPGVNIPYQPGSRNVRAEAIFRPDLTGSLTRLSSF